MLIQIALAGADIANTLKQLAEIAATTIFESTIIKRESLNGVLLQNLCSPLAKMSCLARVYPIPYRNHCIEVVDID